MNWCLEFSVQPFFIFHVLTPSPSVSIANLLSIATSLFIYHLSYEYLLNSLHWELRTASSLYCGRVLREKKSWFLKLLFKQTFCWNAGLACWNRTAAAFFSSRTSSLSVYIVHQMSSLAKIIQDITLGLVSSFVKTDAKIPFNLFKKKNP